MERSFTRTMLNQIFLFLTYVFKKSKKERLIRAFFKSRSDRCPAGHCRQHI
nr:MAG TPA: hypothetical protein [Caudoviricetes sp.]